MDATIVRIVRRAAVINAGVGFVLGPLPVLGSVALLPVHAGMFLSIMNARRHTPAEVPWARVVKATAGATAVRGVANVSLMFVMGSVRLPSALSAVALTRFLAWYMDKVCAAPGAPLHISVRDLWQAFTLRTDATPQEA